MRVVICVYHNIIIMQVLKEAQCEYLEDELWDFMGQQVLPVLTATPSASVFGAPRPAMISPGTVLLKYLEELFLCLEESSFSEVC